MSSQPAFRIITVLVFGLAAVPSPASPAREQPRAAIVVDASKVAAAPEPLPFAAGGRSPDGHALSANSRYLMLDGKPWFPVMGEFHYTRYPAAEWERELLKMKAGGIRVVSTYVFWIHHEEIEGRFEWSGQRDLRRFVELAGRHGLYVWVRVGPWCHGEVRNGGLPDWVLQKSAVRSNDPVYMGYVRRFFGETGRQLQGLFWGQGGPIIGVQLENEYHERGPGKGEEHILALRKAARDAGLEAPFYSITGWDDAAIPPRDVLPVFGGYPDGFWYRPLTELPPSPNYFFTPIRCEENVTDDLTSRRPDIDARFAHYPFLTAEMGGGMAFSYHRRPVMTADDIAALDLVKMGSGVTLYGYYMFHGGTNPEGFRTTLQESQATGYPQDLPVKGYDFQAPLGEFGQMHASFRELKSIHLFLGDFGSELAPMAAYFPQQAPRGKQDRETPRVAVRADGNRGFLFVSNYQRDYPLPERKNFQVRVKLASGIVDVPRQPVEIPSGAYTFWPINLSLGAATLEYATAQPLARLDNPDTYVFFAWPGVAPEFVFQPAAGASVEAPQARLKQDGKRIWVDGIKPGTDIAIRIRGEGGRTTQILVLSREQARNLWKAPLGGRDRLIYSAADLFFEKDRIQLRSTDPARLEFGTYPKSDCRFDGFSAAGSDGIFDRYATRLQPVAISTEIRQLAGAGEGKPVRMGAEVAMAPVDDDFQDAGRWLVRVTPVESAGVSNVFLRIGYQGDVVRIYAGGRLITDDFWHGSPWEIGLSQVAPAEWKAGLELKILPWRHGAPIYLTAGARALLPAGGGAKLQEVRAVPEYQAVAEWR